MASWKFLNLVVVLYMLEVLWIGLYLIWKMIVFYSCIESLGEKRNIVGSSREMRENSGKQ